MDVDSWSYSCRPLPSPEVKGQNLNQNDARYVKCCTVNMMFKVIYFQAYVFLFYACFSILAEGLKMQEIAL